jgi:hypothetical protein
MLLHNWDNKEAKQRTSGPIDEDHDNMSPKVTVKRLKRCSISDQTNIVEDDED